MKSKPWYLLLLLSSTFGVPVAEEECKSDEDILAHLETVSSEKVDEIIIKSDYKVREWLFLYHADQLELDGMFEMTWRNKSLDFSGLNPCHKSIRIKNIQNYWKPHVFFPYSSEIEYFENYQLRIHEDGNLTLSQKIKQFVPCRTDSDRLPFSNSTCTLLWEYMNVADYQKVVINESNVTDSVKMKSRDSLLFDEVKFATTKEGDPGLVYHFSQNSQDVLINFFFPSLLFLFPPWLTLLLGPMAITRCCILMTSLILLSIHYHTAVPVLLGASGVTALSIWKLFTYLYVISIVIELIVITLLASIGRSKTCCFSKRRSAKYEMEPLYEEMNDLRQRKTRKTRNSCRKAALFFDVISFLFFGVILALFCYGYYAERHAAVQMINEFEMESLNIF